MPGREFRSCAAGCHYVDGRAHKLSFTPRALPTENETVHVSWSGLSLQQRGHVNLASRDKGSFACPLIVSSRMSDANATILVIDDDPALRASIGRLLRSLDLDARLFASIPEFLKSDPPSGPTCLVLDVRLPGQSGLDLQRQLAIANREIPIIFITGYGDVAMSVQAMKGGAIEFLTKPFRDQELVDAVQLGLARDRARRENEDARTILRQR